MTRKQLPSLALLLLAIPGCQHLGAKAFPPREGPAPVAQAGESHGVATQKESPFAPGYLRPEEITGEISKLSLAVRNPGATGAERAEALRRMALLHLAPNNPSPSLALAAAAQADYLKLQPAETARQEGEIWLALIHEQLDRELLLQQRSEKIREKEGVLAELGQEKQRLAQKIAAMEGVNAKLKEDIEKLKFIDLALEKKRKNLR